MDAVAIAGLYSSRYQERYGSRIDEMKLHKLLYLVQRESLIRTGRPLFSESILAWQFGPVIAEVRNAYKRGDLDSGACGCLVRDSLEKDILDTVFESYAGKSSWSLSRLTHAEYSWRNARVSCTSGGGHRVMSISDIAKDAKRIASRRTALRALGLS